jgi:hypothetical protein
MPIGYTTEGWGELFLAEAGASAALAGLLFVAVSINLDRIIALRSLPGAALGAIALLVAVLMVSTFALVPEQPRWALGGEVLVVDAADAVEISGSWRHLETAAVLGAWAVAGLLIAPAVLRRMARRESGSSLQARWQRRLQRV